MNTNINDHFYPQTIFLSHDITQFLGTVVPFHLLFHVDSCPIINRCAIFFFFLRDGDMFNFVLSALLIICICFSERLNKHG